MHVYLLTVEIRHYTSPDFLNYDDVVEVEGIYSSFEAACISAVSTARQDLIDGMLTVTTWDSISVTDPPFKLTEDWFVVATLKARPGVDGGWGDYAEFLVKQYRLRGSTLQALAEQA